MCAVEVVAAPEAATTDEEGVEKAARVDEMRAPNTGVAVPAGAVCVGSLLESTNELLVFMSSVLILR